MGPGQKEPMDDEGSPWPQPPTLKVFSGASQGIGGNPLGGNMEDRALTHPQPQGELGGR